VKDPTEISVGEQLHYELLTVYQNADSEPYECENEVVDAEYETVEGQTVARIYLDIYDEDVEDGEKPVRRIVYEGMNPIFQRYSDHHGTWSKFSRDGGCMPYDPDADPDFSVDDSDDTADDTADAGADADDSVSDTDDTTEIDDVEDADGESESESESESDDDADGITSVDVDLSLAAPETTERHSIDTESDAEPDADTEVAEAAE
jgi:hypothetical protein